MLSKYLHFLKQRINLYSSISDKSWQRIEQICTLKEVKKGETLLLLLSHIKVTELYIMSLQKQTT